MAAARRREFLRDLPGMQCWYDPHAQAPAHIVAALVRYDPTLVLRYNRATERWELWRFKGLVVPRRPAALSPEEWTRRATFCFTLEGGSLAKEENEHYRWRRLSVRGRPDWRIRRAIWLADEWRRMGVTREQYIEALKDRLDADDAASDARQDRDDRQTIHDMNLDNYRQLKALMGSANPIFVMGSGQGKR